MPKEQQVIYNDVVLFSDYFSFMEKQQHHIYAFNVLREKLTQIYELK